MAGVLSLRFRYPAAILCSYLVFLRLVRMWIWYVCRRQAAGAGGLDLANIDLTGGGGASGVWEADADADVMPPVAAPQILPEAAWQAVFASTLTRVSKQDHHGWMNGVLRSIVLPFTIVLLLAGGFGWVAHRHCPQAAKLVEVFSCRAE